MPLSKQQCCAADGSTGYIKFSSNIPSECSAASPQWSLVSKTSDLTKGNSCRERARVTELGLLSAEAFCIAKPSMQQDAPGDNIPRESELRPLNSFSMDHRCTGSSQVLSVTHGISHERAATCTPGTAVLLSGLTAPNSHSFPREPIGSDAVPGSTPQRFRHLHKHTGQATSTSPQSSPILPQASMDTHGVTPCCSEPLWWGFLLTCCMHLEESCLKQLPLQHLHCRGALLPGKVVQQSQPGSGNIPRSQVLLCAVSPRGLLQGWAQFHKNSPAAWHVHYKLHTIVHYIRKVSMTVLCADLRQRCCTSRPCFMGHSSLIFPSLPCFSLQGEAEPLIYSPNPSLPPLNPSQLRSLRRSSCRTQLRVELQKEIKAKIHSSSDQSKDAHRFPNSSGKKSWTSWKTEMPVDHRRRQLGLKHQLLQSVQETQADCMALHLSWTFGGAG